jgi:hypothetical protein
MNEFEWRRQMQQLRQPVMPRRDLWPAIDQMLDTEDAQPAMSTPLPRRRFARRPSWLAAAGLAAVILLSVGMGWHLLHGNRTGSTSGDMIASHWKAADPRLAGATIELDAARMELQQAMQQAPDSAALHRLLARTERQQAQLHQLTSQAG